MLHKAGNTILQWFQSVSSSSSSSSPRRRTRRSNSGEDLTLLATRGHSDSATLGVQTQRAKSQSMGNLHSCVGNTKWHIILEEDEEGGGRGGNWALRILGQVNMRWSGAPGVTVEVRVFSLVKPGLYF